MSWVALTGPPRVSAQMSWKSVKVNSTEKVALLNLEWVKRRAG